jgi:hypothetical protein
MVWIEALAIWMHEMDVFLICLEYRDGISDVGDISIYNQRRCKVMIVVTMVYINQSILHF